MSWLLLFIAIVLEVCGTTCMKMSQGLTRPWPTFGLFAFYVAAFAVMALSLKELEVGIAYAVWAGVGTALIAVIGVFWFNESITAMKIAGLLLVIAGVLALNFSSRGASSP